MNIHCQYIQANKRKIQPLITNYRMFIGLRPSATQSPWAAGHWRRGQRCQRGPRTAVAIDRLEALLSIANAGARMVTAFGGER